MGTKKCFKCGRRKSLSEFYVHPRMVDGRLGKCKNCTMADTKTRARKLSNNLEWVAAEKKRGREKYHRLGYRGLYSSSPKKKSEIMMRYKLKYPEKIIIRSITSHIRAKSGFNNHHWSYSIEHAKDTIALSIAQHNKLHRFIVYDQERKMYRRCDTMELLDTKEKHLAYYKSIKNKD